VAWFLVSYRSLTACYGPKCIEADSAYEARRKFAGTAFAEREMGLITAKEVTHRDILKAFHRGGESQIEE